MMDFVFDWFDTWLEVLTLAGILMAIFIGPWDRNRVKTVIRRKDGHFMSMESGGYHIGWLIGAVPCVHDVHYRDTEGNLRLAEVRTSLFGGVSVVSDIPMPGAKRLRKRPGHPVSSEVLGSRKFPGFPAGLKVNQAKVPKRKYANKNGE